YTAVFASLALLAGLPSRADAQYRPRPLNDPATGESYHIEAGGAFWWAAAGLLVSRSSPRLVGTHIADHNDLGLVDQRFPALALVLRPSRSSKFRAEYVPIKYEQTASLRRTIVFNGQAYVIGVPVASTLDWKQARFAYEYDFLVKNTGFAGF